MTTNVTINARCDSEKKQVQVTITDPSKGLGYFHAVEEFILQDGESAERAVWDGRVIHVLEVEK